MKVKLTQREENIMQILWKLGKALVREILEELPDPKPPVTTVSSSVRKLEDMGLVGHHAFGKTHQYYPILEQKEYRRQAFRSLLKNYFSGSYEQMVSFFVQEEEVKMEELEALIEKMKQDEAEQP